MAGKLHRRLIKLLGIVVVLAGVSLWMMYIVGRVTYTFSQMAYNVTPAVLCSRNLEHFNLGEHVPKILHRMWISIDVESYTDMNDEYISHWQSCVNYNHGHTVVFWNKEKVLDFLRRHYKWFLSTYNSYRYDIQRVDAARYFILYHYGGIYLDMDIECLQSFDDFFEMFNYNQKYDMVLAVPDSYNPVTNPYFNNNFIVTKAGHPLLHDVISKLIPANRFYMLAHYTVMMSAGPVFFTTQFQNYPCKDKILILTRERARQLFSHKSVGHWHTTDSIILHYLSVNWLSLSVLCIIFVAVSLYCR